MLVDGILGWARGQGTEVVGLTVTSNNDAARHFYERMGFTVPGMAAQDRHDLALLELGMQRPIGQSGARPAGCHGVAPSGSRGAGASGAVPRPMPAGPARERSPITGFEPASPSLPGCSSPTSRVVAAVCVYAKEGMNLAPLRHHGTRTDSSHQCRHGVRADPAAYRYHDCAHPERPSARSRRHAQRVACPPHRGQCLPPGRRHRADRHRRRTRLVPPASVAPR